MGQSGRRSLANSFRFLTSAVALVGSQTFAREVEPPPTVALFYAAPLPVAALSRFDWVVVQPGNVHPGELEALSEGGTRVFAYLSVGEARSEDGADPRWILGRNEDWDTAIVDPAASGWRRRLLARAAELERQGYGGLFLDTLDSYAQVLTSAADRQLRVKALTRLVRTLRRRHPGLALFFNRGFEVLDEAGELACAVAAESVFYGWDPATRQYVDVPPEDREWVVARLQGIRDRFGIPAVALDYLPPSRAADALDGAGRLQALGLVPWISTPAFDWLGFGVASARVPRLLLVHDGAEAPSPEQAPIGRLAAPQAQALGFGVDLHDVRTGLPPDAAARGYAGIVTWFTDDELPSSLDYAAWLARQIASGVRVAILGRPGFAVSEQLLDALGLAATVPGPGPLARIAISDALIGHEAKPRLRARSLLPWRARSPDVRVHLRVEDAAARPVDPVITAGWGGLAMQPYLLESGYQGHTRWIVDPAAFLSAALGVEAGAE